MAIKEKLDEGDLALVEVLEDPIWFAEFMRSTRDGSAAKQTWPDEFAYRHYQRDLMTDKNPYIVLTGGRAVGKCQPRGSRIYTTDGYKTIHRILQENEHGTCEVYCIDHATGRFTTARAIITKDQWTKIYSVTTESGYTVKASGNHPVLTQFGYKMIDDLIVNEDRAVVVTKLPWNSTQNLWRSSELRYLGYRFFDRNWFPEIPFFPRFKAIEQDYKLAAEEMGMVWSYEDGGIVNRRPSRSAAKHAIKYAAIQLGWDQNLRKSNYDLWPRLVPYTLRQERTENLRIFLESLLAQYAEFSLQEITLDCKYPKVAVTLQEMFLKCGVEMRITDRAILRTATKTAHYYLCTEFDIPGVSLDVPYPNEANRSDDTRFDTITSIELANERGITYAVYVYDHHNYISEICVHNSLVLEDKQLFDIVNQDTEYPQTKEMLLTTANKTQLEPIHGRVISRATVSPLIKDFLGNRVNRSDGTMDFRFSDIRFIHRARIAGNKEQNVV